MKSYGVSIQMKATEQYFPVVVASLSNDDVKMPNFTFSGGRKHNTTTFFLLS